MRAGELIGMQWDEVNAEQRFIVIPKEHEKTRKGGAGAAIEQGLGDTGRVEEASRERRAPRVRYQRGSGSRIKPVWFMHVTNVLPHGLEVARNSAGSRGTAQGHSYAIRHRLANGAPLHRRSCYRPVVSTPTPLRRDPPGA